ncbi:MAG: O-antigen ligase family protein, partial [Elusimicrobiota bacterium]|nr:O-antigen ligase family protein [Elusimicrobiota bacterium]
MAGAVGMSMLFCGIYEKLNIRKIVFTNRALLTAVLILLALLTVSFYIVLNTTSPLDLACFAEDNKTTSYTKTVYSIEGKGDYLLRLDVNTSKLETVKGWAGSVRIYSVNSFGQGQLIKIYSINDIYNGLIDIPFSTLDDTYYIRLSFVNYYKDTSFTVRSAAIINPDTGDIVENIKLKYKFLPESVSTRIGSINLKEHSLRMRFAFFKDALKVVKRSPIIGMGGKGWTSVYPMFRSFEYWSKEAHSYPIQIWVEVGTVGLFIAIGFIVSYLIELYKNYNLSGDQRQRIEMIGIVGFSFIILAHSIIDFDLSLGAVAVLLWTSFAIAGSFVKNSCVIDVRRGNKIKRFAILLSCFFALICSSIFMANIFSDKAQQALESGDIYSAYNYQSIAVKLDYFNSDARRVFA